MLNINSVTSISDISEDMIQSLSHVKSIITRDFHHIDWERQSLQKLINVGSCVNTQKAAPAIERWIGYNLQLTRSPKYGDFISPLGETIEFKYSMASASGRLRFLQLRPNQPIDATFLMAIDLSKKFAIYCFRLTQQQVQQEVEKKPISSHGRQETHARSLDKEYTLSLDIDSANFKRWCRLYRDKGLERVILSKNLPAPKV